MVKKSILTILALGVVIPLPALAAYKQQYFSKTLPGSWASYQLNDLKYGFKTTLKHTRLADRDGRPILSIETDYDAGDGKRATSITEYTLASGFRFDADALSFQRFATGILVGAPGSALSPLPADAISAIAGDSTDYAKTASFAASEKLEGAAADRYTYTRKSDSGLTETGEIWLSPAVPFGLLKQVSASRDSAGAIEIQYELTLLASGEGSAEAATAAPVAAPVAAAAGPIETSLADALAKELVRIHVEVEAEGATLALTLENKTEEELRVTLPAGATSLPAADPISKLTWKAAKEQVVVVGPGDQAAPVRVQQTAPWNVTEGRFTLSVYEGTPLYSGSVTFGAGR